VVSGSDELVDKFVAFQENEKQASPRTLANYTAALRFFTEWMGDRFKSWDAVTADHFRAYLFDLMKHELGRNTIRLRFSALRSFYKYLVERQGFGKNPVAEIQMPKAEKGLPVIISVKQAVALLEAPFKIKHPKQAPHWLPFRDAAILELFYSTGLRLTELASLKVEDIDWISETLRVIGKGNKERLLPIGGPAIVALQNYRHKAEVHQGALFLSKLKKQVSTRAINDLLKKYISAAEIPFEITPHKLRHSFATHLLDNGADKERLKVEYDKAHPRA